MKEGDSLSQFHVHIAQAVVVLLIIFLIATVIADKTTITKRMIQTDVIINSSASEVWKVLTNFEEYPKWNPFIQQVTGTARPGKQLKVQMKSGDGTITFSPTVLVVLPDRELRWLGRVFIPGLFDGEHSFVIEPLSENQVRLVQSEAFNGLLIPFSESLLEGTKLNFEAMNQALKKRVEETN